MVGGQGSRKRRGTLAAADLIMDLPGSLQAAAALAFKVREAHFLSDLQQGNYETLLLLRVACGRLL